MNRGPSSFEMGILQHAVVAVQAVCHVLFRMLVSFLEFETSFSVIEREPSRHIIAFFVDNQL